MLVTSYNVRSLHDQIQIVVIVIWPGYHMARTPYGLDIAIRLASVACPPQAKTPQCALCINTVVGNLARHPLHQ
jgi:hypothetical protein